LKAAQANRSSRPISKKPFTKRGWWMAQGVDPEFKPQYHTHTKKRQKERKEIRRKNNYDIRTRKLSV
jgi:hypothetical protein